MPGPMLCGTRCISLLVAVAAGAAKGSSGLRKVGVMRMGLYVAWRQRTASEDGATAVEYALMLALIAVVIVAAVTILGQNSSELYENPELVNALT
jgi:pilus assembly protein Flp/PilA